MEKQILKMMIKEHQLIENLFDDFEKAHRRNLNAASRIFRNLIWNLEKHIFFEERVLHSIYSIWNGNIREISRILRNHEELYFLIRRADDSDFDEFDILSLKEALKEHFEFEKTVFYPKLEEVLNKRQKEFFLERAEEIISE